MKSIAAAFGLLALAAPALLGSANAQDVNPEAIKIFPPGELEFGPPEGMGASTVNVLGDRTAEGEYYAYVNRFMPGNFSRPHYHQNDRVITVLKGTWWVGSGTDYDPENNTVPVGAGGVVIHYAGEVHYDGAKDEEVWVLITGIGPSAGTQVEPEN